MLDMLKTGMRLGLEPIIDGGGRGLVWMFGELVLAVSAIVPSLAMAFALGRVGDWTRQDLLFLVGFVLTARGLAQVVGGGNILMISRKIGRGQLDHNLLQPLPLWKSLVVEGFGSLDLIVSQLLGVGCLCWGLSYVARPEPAWWFALIVNIVCAAGLVIATQYLWGTLAFYAPQSAEEINTITDGAISQLSVLPLNGAIPFVRAVLTSILPAAMIGAVPASYMLHAYGWRLYTMPLFALAFGIITIVIFRQGLRHYGKYSVSRYSSFGHRR